MVALGHNLLSKGKAGSKNEATGFEGLDCLANSAGSN